MLRNASIDVSVMTSYDTYYKMLIKCLRRIKMKKFMTRVVALALGIIMCLSLAGCGNKKASETEGPAYVYIPQYTDIAFEENEGINNAYISNGKVYCLKYSYDNVTYTQEYTIDKIDIETGEQQSYPVTKEDDEYINSIYIDNNENIWVLLEYSKYDDTTYELIESRTSLVKYNNLFEEQQRIDLSSLKDQVDTGDYGFYIQAMLIDDESNIYLQIGDYNILVLDPNGSLLFQNKADSWFGSMGLTGEGKVIVTGYSADGSYEAKIIDVAAKGYGKSYSNLPSTYNSNSIIPYGETGILINTDDKIVSYDLSTGERTDYLTWMDCDITFDNLNSFGVLDNGDIIAVTTTYSNEDGSRDGVSIIHLVKTDASTVTMKTTLTLGCLYLDEAVKKQIVKFNKNNEKYRISTIQYYEDGMDYEDAVTNMNNAIASNNCPDMIAISGEFNADDYVEKGMFVDLMDYIESDPDIKLEDYQENILTMYTSSDTLYALLPSYSLMTLVGKEAIIGDRDQWNFEDVQQIMNDNPNLSEFMLYSTKDVILQNLLAYDMGHYIDYGEGTCNFNSQDFIDLLEFANTFPTEYEYDEEAESDVTRLRNNELLVMDTYISSLDQYQLYRGLVGEDATFIGYPTSGGNGNVVSPSTQPIAISTQCEYQDAAWEFLRVFLLEDFQNNLDWDFPVLKSAFDAQMQEAMTPETYIDENGNEVESESTWGYNDITITIPTATQEVVDEFKALVAKIDHVAQYDTELFSIISEEITAFFEGNKTAAEVADIIQSRVSIYINESK